MNNEKIQTLFDSVEIATEALTSATLAANNIQHLNGDKVTIQKLVNDFVAINNNSNAVLARTNDALIKITNHAVNSINAIEDRANLSTADAKKRTLFLRWTAMITIIAASIVVGFAVGIYLSHLPITKDIDTRMQIRNKFGVIVNKSEILIPLDIKIKTTHDGGVRYIPIK